MDDLVISGLTQLVNNTGAPGSTLGGCAIEISILSLDWRQREAAVLTVGKRAEGVQVLKVAGWADPKKYSLIPFAPGFGCPVKIPVVA